jgi:hypothetical protein
MPANTGCHNIPWGDGDQTRVSRRQGFRLDEVQIAASMVEIRQLLVTGNHDDLRIWKSALEPWNEDWIVEGADFQIFRAQESLPGW